MFSDDRGRPIRVPGAQGRLLDVALKTWRYRLLKTPHLSQGEPRQPVDG
jgi:hypothetical protein